MSNSKVIYMIHRWEEGNRCFVLFKDEVGAKYGELFDYDPQTKTVKVNSDDPPNPFLTQADIELACKKVKSFMDESEVN